MFMKLMDRLLSLIHAQNKVEAQSIKIVRKIPRRAHTVEEINKAPIEYYLNDPSTPDLRGVIDYFEPRLPYAVNGFTGGGFSPNSSRGQAAQCYVIIGTTIDFMLNHMKTPITKWHATNTLFVNPRAGRKLNAFYDRRSLKFYFGEGGNGPVYTAESCDIVAHETGHALLDAIRPDFWGTQSLEVPALHEAFGDCTAILSALSRDAILDHVIQETDGDLLKSNVVSKLAEQMAGAVYTVTKGANGVSAGAMRDACNSFVYQKPEDLLGKTADNVLSRECHSFSRVWTGAWYEILVKIYQKHVSEGMERKAALIMARDVAASYLLLALPGLPLTVRLFEALAKQMLLVDGENGKKYQKILQQVFKSRKIIAPIITMLSDLKFDVQNLPEHEESSFQKGRIKVVRTTAASTIRLSDHLRGEVMALDYNPLYDLEIDVPVEAVYHLDKKGRLVDFVESTDEEIIESARCCLADIHAFGLVGPDADTPFEVVDGKLVRSHIVCRGCFDNSTNPQAPEYGKGWKAANNAGCGCQRPAETTPTTTVRVGCSVRVRYGSGINYRPGSSAVNHRGC